MMFRLKVALIVLGCILAFVGAQEFIVSSGTTPEPQGVELADLEAGWDVSNNHVRIGQHLAIYPATVYSYKTTKGAAVQPGPDAQIQYCFYPIVSHSHPFPQALEKLEEKHGELKNVPETEATPRIATFAALAKTRRFRTLGAIPESIDAHNSVQGLVINRIQSLNAEESKLVHQSFPQLDLNKVLILEEGRRPASVLKSLSMVVGGAALAAAGLILMWVKRGRVAANQQPAEHPSAPSG